jgi:hypothetical protein
VIVAVAFSCANPDRVSMRGVIFCPQMQTRFLLSRLRTQRQKALNRGAVVEVGACRHWIEEHFKPEGPPPSRIEFSLLTLKRYFAFTRVSDVAVGYHCIDVRFDVFIGPGEVTLAVNGGDKAYTPARAIHGFADVAHNALFDNEIAYCKRRAVIGHSVLCLVEQPNDLLSDGWRVRSDGIFEAGPKHEVRTVLLIETPAHGSENRLGLYADAVGHKVRNSLMRGFLFRARLIVEIPEDSDQLAVCM